jgi:sugar phosphate isomerase/epimerase
MLDCGLAMKDFVDVIDGDRAGAAAFFRRHDQGIDDVEFEDRSSETDLRTEVGRGSTDWNAVTLALGEDDYPARMVVEQNPPSSSPRDSETASHRFVRGLFGSSAPSPSGTRAMIR